MNQSAENSRNYTTADIQQYLDGKMDAAEMHAFEKALMDDPFLADAMEGLQQTQAQYGANRFNDELQQLEKQLASRIDTEKTAPVVPVTKFRWWAVAAAAVVIIVAGLFIFNSDDTENKESAPIAVIEKKADSGPVLDSSSPSALITVTDSTMRGAEMAPSTLNATKSNDDNALLDRKKPITIPDNEAKKFEIQTAPAAAPSASVTKDLAKEKEAQAIPKSETIAVAPKTDSVAGNAVSRSAEIVADKENKQAPVTFKKNNAQANGFINSYKGLLISPDNKPIGNAELIINQKDKAITNANGIFNFNNKDTQVSVLVNSPGYKERHFVLKNTYAFNELQVEPSNTTLNETVIINKNADRERTKGFINYPKVMVQDAEPEIGWIEFEKYIEANRKNIQHLDSKSGEVVLSFQVSKDGSLSSFKIEQSLTPAQDEEAIRLIKTGPSWHLLKGKKARAVVIIRF